MNIIEFIQTKRISFNDYSSKHFTKSIYNEEYGVFVFKTKNHGNHSIPLSFVIERILKYKRNSLVLQEFKERFPEEFI